MSRAHTAVFAGCLVLGLADLLCLDLAALPAVLEQRRGATSSAVAGERSLLVRVEEDRPAPRPTAPSPTRELAADSPARLVQLAGVAGEASGRPAARRALDPELSAQTGAEPEPEVRTRADRASGFAPPATGPDRTSADEPAPAGRLAERGPGTLRSEPVRVHFALGSAELGDFGRARLDRVAVRLADEPALVATVDGHADRQGEATGNLDLSRNRADKVADYIAARGIARARMTVRAFGESLPLDRGLGEAANRANRRAEIRISRDEPAPGAQ
jgi:outer membrane protein OmpA-like peptidoglycan-associated protein